jgi:hypothetical protein
MLRAAVVRLTPSAAVLGLLLLAGSARAGPVRLSADCVEIRPAGYVSLPRNGDPFVFLATAATRARARQLQRVVRARRIYETWARDFDVDGNPGRPLGPGDGRPFEIIVAPHNDAFFRLTHSDGADLRACDAHGQQDDHHDALVVADNLSSEPAPHGRVDWSANVLAHELFHAFQGGAMGHYPSEGQWWIEATAEWGGDDIFGFPPGSTRERDLDASLFGHPELPLDLLARSGPGYMVHHAYAVWRFVQYLQSVMPTTNTDTSTGSDRLFAYLVATFQAIGRGTPADEAIRTLFPAGVGPTNEPGGRGFTDVLGRFWLQHLPPDLGDQLPGGPVSLQDSVDVPEITPGGGPGQVTAEWDGAAPAFGIRTVALNVSSETGDVWVMPGSMSPSDDFVGINGCLRWAAPIGTTSYFGIPVPAGRDRVALVFVNTEPMERQVHLQLQAVETGESAPC